ncbi:MAG: hypothetical protein ACH36H_06660, partial [Candidatus Nanopelagicales bacterium]
MDPSSRGEPAWTPGAGIADAPGVGPVFDALAAIDEAVGVIGGQLAAAAVAAADLAGLAEGLHAAGARLA